MSPLGIILICSAVIVVGLVATAVVFTLIYAKKRKLLVQRGIIPKNVAPELKRINEVEKQEKDIARRNDQVMRQQQAAASYFRQYPMGYY